VERPRHTNSISTHLCAIVQVGAKTAVGILGTAIFENTPKRIVVERLGDWVAVCSSRSGSYCNSITNSREYYKKRKQNHTRFVHSTPTFLAFVWFLA